MLSMCSVVRDEDRVILGPCAVEDLMLKGLLPFFLLL